MRATPRPGCAYLAGRPMLVAHRGGAKLAPENTLEAFHVAVRDWGADMLEMDVRLSADGVVVVIHDETVDRTTDGSGRVRDMTWGELQDLDAGFRFTDPSGQASYRGRGVRLPSFDEVLEQCPEVRINVEAKEAAVAGPLVEVIRGRGAAHRVLVAAERERNRVAARGYEGPWGASRRDCALFWLAHLLPGGRRYTPSVDVIQVPEMWKGRRLVTPRFVAEAHLRNIPVHVWTVDEPDDMRRLLRMGVDAIQSDRPDLLSAVLMDEANRPPPPLKGKGPESPSGSHESGTPVARPTEDESTAPPGEGDPRAAR